MKRNDETGARAGAAAAGNPVEEVDLVDNTNQLQSALQKQRVEQVKAQEGPSDKPLRLSTLTCVICMDTPTDITATSCGKFSL